LQLAHAPCVLPYPLQPAIDTLNLPNVLCTKRLLATESDMDVAELSYTANLLRHSLDGAQDASACELLDEEFVKQLMQAYKDCKIVFSAHQTTGRGKVGEHHHHLSTGLSNDHLVRAARQCQQ
jgi:hypothetical protein